MVLPAFRPFVFLPFSEPGKELGDPVSQFNVSKIFLINTAGSTKPMF
jgi:hypothetical protein